VTLTRDVDTPAVPPGIELNIDRGKAVPPGIESKFGPITPDVDTPVEKALPPGIELNVDRGKLPAPETVVRTTMVNRRNQRRMIPGSASLLFSKRKRRPQPLPVLSAMEAKAGAFGSATL
jgi:hypothetical protein